MAEENNISFKRQQPVDYVPPTEETQEVEETTQEDDVTEFPKFESRQEEEGKLEEPVEDNQEAPEEVAEDNNDDPKEDVFDQFFEDKLINLTINSSIFSKNNLHFLCLKYLWFKA
mgnify:CR=1 FL=1